MSTFSPKKHSIILKRVFKEDIGRFRRGVVLKAGKDVTVKEGDVVLYLPAFSMYLGKGETVVWEWKASVLATDDRFPPREGHPCFVGMEMEGKMKECLVCQNAQSLLQKMLLAPSSPPSKNTTRIKRDLPQNWLNDFYDGKISAVELRDIYGVGIDESPWDERR